MSLQRYRLPAMLLHWAQAALILWLLWLGWTMVDLPKGAERSAAYNLHKSLGLLSLLVVACRLGWRWRGAPPPSLAHGNLARVATWVHRGLYLFLLAAPLAGFLASSFTQYPVKFFGWPLPRLFAPDETWNATFKSLHFAFVWGGCGLLLLHLAGVVRHQLAGQPVLQRMLPARLFKK
ncbi:cytochrome b/b6 domain-containing protein [Dechloromonas sp. ZS-1]|uniref:cytochrome b n=1 Tax=Dechloromonas sp. ZS-1 TaxID=3138067 RepID=UPI0031FCC148